jgi:probable addiction module antidote protein
MTAKAISKKSIEYQKYLLESLKDPHEAAGYLNAALDGGDISVFLMALQNVVAARGGVTKLANQTNKSRTSLYKTISSKGNPYLKSTNELLSAMGMHLAVAPNRKVV